MVPVEALVPLMEFDRRGADDTSTPEYWAALERHVLRNDGRWVHVDAADDLLGAVIPALMGTGVAR